MRSVEARVEAYIIRTFDRLPYDQALAEYNALMGKKAASRTGTLSEYEETLVVYMDAALSSRKYPLFAQSRPAEQ